MIFLQFILFTGSYFLSIWLSEKAAKYHYKSYKGDKPLYVIYGAIFVVVFFGISLQIITQYSCK